MEKQEIISGIRQAIERGSSLEQAKRSFVNAGYNWQDVEDSSRSFSASFANLPSASTFAPKMPQMPSPSSIQMPQILQQSSQFLMPREQKSHKSIILIIILAVILALLLGLLVASIFFKEQMLDLLSKIGINL